MAAWQTSRHCSHAGRGFRYQDAVAADLATQSFPGEDGILVVIPEGLDDEAIADETNSITSQEP